MYVYTQCVNMYVRKVCIYMYTYVQYKSWKSFRFAPFRLNGTETDRNGNGNGTERQKNGKITVNSAHSPSYLRGVPSAPRSNFGKCQAGSAHAPHLMTRAMLIRGCGQSRAPCACVHSAPGSMWS